MSSRMGVLNPYDTYVICEAGRVELVGFVG